MLINELLLSFIRPIRKAYAAKYFSSAEVGLILSVCRASASQSAAGATQVAATARRPAGCQST